MIDWIRFILTALLMIAGLVIFGISTFGVFRFKYAVNRMHAAAMGDTMGVGLCLVGMAISAPDWFTAAKKPEEAEEAKPCADTAEEPVQAEEKEA